MFSGLCSILGRLLDALNLRSFFEYLIQRLFVPPHLPVAEHLPRGLRLVPGADSLFEAAVGEAREAFYWVGVAEGIFFGVLLTIVFIMVSRFLVQLFKGDAKS